MISYLPHRQNTVGRCLLLIIRKGKVSGGWLGQLGDQGIQKEAFESVRVHIKRNRSCDVLDDILSSSPTEHRGKVFTRHHSEGESVRGLVRPSWRSGDPERSF